VAAEARLDDLFEASSPLARRLAAEDVAVSPEKLVARARELIPHLTEEEKVATLNAHPRIGARAAAMSTRSRREQGEDEVPELDELNRDYERRFGFRFVVFVNRRPRSEIARVLRERLRRSREEEMAAGLDAIVDIAADRLRS
jgi:allantoinase